MSTIFSSKRNPLPTKITSSLEFDISELLQCVPVTDLTSSQNPSPQWTYQPEPKEVVWESEMTSLFHGPATCKTTQTSLDSCQMFSPGEFDTIILTCALFIFLFLSLLQVTPVVLISLALTALTFSYRCLCPNLVPIYFLSTSPLPPFPLPPPPCHLLPRPLPHTHLLHKSLQAHLHCLSQR